MAIQRASTEVPNVDVETAEREIAQDVDEDNLQGKVIFRGPFCKPLFSEKVSSLKIVIIIILG